MLAITIASLLLPLTLVTASPIVPRQTCPTTVITTSAGTLCDLGNGLVILNGNTINLLTCPAIVLREREPTESTSTCATTVITTSAGVICDLGNGDVLLNGNTINLLTCPTV